MALVYNSTVFFNIENSMMLAIHTFSIRRIAPPHANVFSGRKLQTWRSQRVFQPSAHMHGFTHATKNASGRI